jgi:transcriptional regulator with XRE-family HTH domain
MKKIKNEQVEKIIRKITDTRIKKGFSYENMAFELQITPAAYRKIEIGTTNLSVARLLQITEILSAKLSDFLDIGNEIFQQTNNENSTGYQQKIENFYQANKEIQEKLAEQYEFRLKDKDEQITLLKSLLEKK